MIGDTHAAVGTLCPFSSCITDQIATDENIWLCECGPACLCLCCAPVPNKASFLPEPPSPTASSKCFRFYLPVFAVPYSLIFL